MTEIERANGHRLNGFAKLLQSEQSDLPRPEPEKLGFDLAEAMTGVVSLRSEIPEEAYTASILGTEREGNGVLIDDQGLVLTIGYLVTEASRVYLMTSEGTAVRAEVIAYDYESGFGMVRAMDRMPGRPLQIGEASALRPGDDVVAAGHENGGGAIAATVVSKREFAGYWEYLLDEAIFTTPPHPNWGGTALFNNDGKLCGLGSLFVQEAQADNEVLPGNMFVPIDLLPPIMDEMLRLGRPDRPSRPWLGMFTAEAASHLVVAGIAPDGPADRAGIEAHDIVLQVEDQQVSTLPQMYRSMWGLGPAGTRITLTIVRDGKMGEIAVESADRYALLRQSRTH